MEHLSFFLVLMIGVLLTTWLGYLAGNARNRGMAGALCGFLLGPLGIVLALFLPAGPPPPQTARRSSRPRRRRSTRRRVVTAPRGSSKPVKPIVVRRR